MDLSIIASLFTTDKQTSHDFLGAFLESDLKNKEKIHPLQNAIVVVLLRKHHYVMFVFDQEKALTYYIDPLGMPLSKQSNALKRFYENNGETLVELPYRIQVFLVKLL